MREGFPAAKTQAAYFTAGASLALLNQRLDCSQLFGGVMSRRLALRAAAAAARLMRLREDEGQLRDAAHLESFGDPGRAGRLHRLWRQLVVAAPLIDEVALGQACELLDLPTPQGLPTLIGQLQALAAAPDDPVSLAAQAAGVFGGLPAGPEREILGFWAADKVLAARIGWERPLPLFMATALDSSLRRRPDGRRARPGDADWPTVSAEIATKAAIAAHDLAGELARRAERLRTIAPLLRARGARIVIDLLLADDCVAPSFASRRAGLSDRATRRLFDRLIELGVVRELSGRNTFRLYGL